MTTAVVERISSNRRRATPPASTVAPVRTTSVDALLVARIAAGDERALAEVYDLLAAAVYRSALQVVGRSSVAQDVVQDVLVDLWCHPERYDEALGSLHSFLVVCARHRALDLVRSELRRAAREERSERLVPHQREPSASDRVAAEETACAVRDAVHQLPTCQREAVELAYFQGLAYRDVARVLGVPEGTAKSRLRLALRRLEELLDRQLLDAP